ncbi:MAG: ABC transporter substrate-binding protein [Candidatus Riflebacteria bacterium]|nr:ABC transporter substrate-binding protein [Candidatus Riflebacteria bacterium]
MKQFIIGVVATWLIIVLLIVHDSKRTSSLNKLSSSGTRVEVVFWHAMSGPLGKVMEELIDRFNKKQEKYYIKSVCMGNYDTLAKKLLASLVAGRAPDIGQNYEHLTKKFIKHKKIVCLDELIASEPEDIKADIVPVLLQNNTYNGKVWSFPFNKSVPVLYYNKKLFKEAGIDPESPPKTLDELASYARKLTRKDEKGNVRVYGYATNRANVWMFMCRVLQYGGKYVTDEDHPKSLLHEPAAVKALSFIQDILKENLAYEGQGYDHQNDFKAQRVAMIDNSIVSKVFMETGAGIPFEYGVAPLPGAATYGVVLSGSNINIFDNGNKEKIAGAWEFIKDFTSTETGAEWSYRTTYLPVRKSSLASEKLQKVLESDRNLKAPYIQLDYCHFEPRIGCWFEVRDLMADYLERATLEMTDPETILKKMSQDIDGILKHARD